MRGKVQRRVKYQIAFSLPLGKRKRFKRLCRGHGKSMSEILREFVADYKLLLNTFLKD